MLCFRLRRLTALLSQLLLLQLAFASGTSTCPLDSRHAAASMPMAHAGGAYGQHKTAGTERATEHLSAPGSQDAGAHCDMTCPPATCGATGHCSLTAALEDTTETQPLATALARAASGADDAPHSVNSAPEPPPPGA